VAAAVARVIVGTGEAPALTPIEIDDRIAAAMWEPVYLPYRPA
jgi:hypothetical protein